MKRKLFAMCLVLAVSALVVARAGHSASQTVPADAASVMAEFWSLVESNRFSETPRLFAEDIVFIDPIWGRFEGKEAAAKFMNSFDGNGDGCCTLDRLVGSGTTGWAFWTLHGADAPEPWVGVYEVTDGKMTYYRDIHERVYSEAEKAALTGAPAAD